MSNPVKVAFAAARVDRIPAFVQRFDADTPPAELLIFSEFPPERGRWIPYRIDQSFATNLERLRSAIGDRRLTFAGTLLDPEAPYRGLRWMPLLIAPLRTLIYNPHLDHYMLRPRGIPHILRHLTWRTVEKVEFEIRPGGGLYTALWRMRHPRELRRPSYRVLGRAMGELLGAFKNSTIPKAIQPALDYLQPGISVVVPSRSGLPLLRRLLPLLHGELAGIPNEIVVSDNGSSDGSLEWLRSEYPDVRVEHSIAPLSFARAVNRGIAVARYRKICLLNNDMEIEPNFFRPLLAAFEQIPDLFCATAQIFFPPGQRREETGKAVMRPGIDSFPVHCVEPIDGENLTYVLYGSGGCSLYDAAKLRALGSIGEVYQPAYVEDLDAGYRAWRCGWPTVFVADSKTIHHHRTTTSRYHFPGELERVLEVNYLRFLARSVHDSTVFRRLWENALSRLDSRAALEHHLPSMEALTSVDGAWQWREPSIGTESDEFVIGIGSGDVAVFPGRAKRTGPVVLVASCYSPYPLSHGGAVRMYNLLRRGAADFTQILVTFVDELHTPPDELLEICAEIVQVRRIGSHVRGEPTRPDAVADFDRHAFRAALRLTIRKWRAEIVQLEFTQMALYAADCAPAKTLLVEHDITIDLYRQLLSTTEDWETRRQLERWTIFEPQAWRNVDCVAVMSTRDRQMIEGARYVAVLPNGVDLDRYRPSADEPEPGRLLFVGSFAHLPNLLALDFYLMEVWPHLPEPRPILHVIAGGQHTFHFDRIKDRLRFRLDHPGLELEGFVADVRPAYRRATAVIAPLRASAGTNIKIMEAMAMGKAIVSTPGGVNGLELTPGREVLIETDGVKFAGAISTLMRDRELRIQLEGQGRAAAEERFSWDRIAEEQKMLYERLLKS